MAQRILWSLDKRQAGEKYYHTLPMVKIYLSNALINRLFTRCSGQIQKWSILLKHFQYCWKYIPAERRGLRYSCFDCCINWHANDLYLYIEKRTSIFASHHHIHGALTFATVCFNAFRQIISNHFQLNVLPCIRRDYNYNVTHGDLWWYRRFQ